MKLKEILAGIKDIKFVYQYKENKDTHINRDEYFVDILSGDSPIARGTGGNYEQAEASAVVDAFSRLASRSKLSAIESGPKTEIELPKKNSEEKGIWIGTISPDVTYGIIKDES